MPQTIGEQLGLQSEAGVPQFQQPPPPPRGMVPPTPTGTGNLVTSALGSGLYNTAGLLGSAAQAGATAVGATDAAKAAADFADRQRATAATYARKDLEESPWYSPSGLAYRVLQGAPAAAGTLAASLGAAALAPEAAVAGMGAGTLTALGAGLPLAVGGNVQTSEATRGRLTQGEALKSLAYGVPEAAIGAYPFARLGGMVARGTEGTLLNAATHQFAAQGAAAAGQDFIAQQMGDPNRPIPERMSEMLQSVLTGGTTGAIMGAGIHAVSPIKATAKVNPANMSNDQMESAVNGALKLLPPPSIQAGPPMDTLSAQDLINRARAGNQDAIQEMMRRAGPPSPTEPMKLLPQPVMQAGPPMDTLPAEDLINRARAGDRSATEEMMRRAGPPSPVEPQRLLPAPQGVEAPVATGETIPLGGETGAPPVVEAGAPEYRPARPFSDWTPEQILTEAKNVKETDPVKFRQLAYEAAFRARMEESATPQLPTPDVSIPIGNGMMLWPDGTIAPPNRPSPFDLGAASRGAEPNRVPPGWVRWPDGSYGPPNAPSPFDQGAASRAADAGPRPPQPEAPAAPQPEVPAEHPLAALSGDDLASAVRRQARTVPKWLNTSSFEAAQQSVRDNIAENKTTVIRNAQEKIGKALGVIDDQGKVIPKAGAEEPVNKAVDATAQDVNKEVDTANRPERDAIPATHQARWDEAEALRDNPQVKADPALISQLDDAQTKLQNPQPGIAKKFGATIDRIKTAVAGEDAKDKLSPDREQQTTPPTPPAERPFEPSPAAQNIVKSVKLTPQASARIKKAIADKAAAAKPAEPSPDQTLYEHLSAGMPPSPGRILPDQTPIRQALAKAQASLDELKKVPAVTTDKPKHDAALQKQLTKGIADAQARLDAAKKNPNALADDHFVKITPGGTQNSPLEEHFDDFSPAVQGLIKAHQNDQQGVVDASPQHFSQRLLRPPPPTQVGADIEHIVASGGTLKHTLDYLAANGESGQVKTVANLLRRNGVDASMRIADDRLPSDAGGQYDSDTNQIDLRPGEASGQLALHEGIHAATARAIEANTPAAKEMDQLYQKVKADSPDNSAYGLESLHEFVAEAYTNNDFRDFLKSQSAPGQPVSMWQAFKNVVGKLLGARPGSEQNMLDRVMETGNRLIGENQTAPATATSPLYSSIERVKGLEGMVDRIRTAIRGTKLGYAPAIQRAMLGMRDGGDIVRATMDHIPSAARSFAASHTTEARENGWNKVGDAGYRQYRALDDTRRQSFNRVAAATVIGIDGRKPWASQDPALFRAKNAADLKARTDEAYREWNKLGADGQAAYNKMVDTHQLHAIAAMTQGLDSHVKNNFASDLAKTRGFQTDPGHLAQFDAMGHDDPSIMKTAMLKELTARKSELDTFLNTAKSANKGEVPKQYEALSRYASDIDTLNKQLQGTPHFRLSHGDGDYFVSGALAKNAAGAPDEAKMNLVRAAMAKEGFDHVTLDHDVANNSLYVRVDSLDQMSRLRNAFLSLKDAGTLSDEKDIGSGLAQQGGKFGVGPKALEETISALQKSRPEAPEGMSKDEQRAFNAKWDESIQDFSRMMLDMLPSSSASKIYARREDVQGFEKDLGETFRNGVGAVSRMLAKQGMATEKAAATSGMLEELRTLKHNREASPADQVMAQQAVDELMRREMEKPLSQPSGFAKFLMALSQRMEIGTNPMYFLTLLTQNLTLSLPRLGSRVGYLPAAQAMAKATVPSFNILRAILKGPDGAAAGLRRDTLIKAGIDDKTADYLMHLDNMGAFHQSMTHVMTEKSEGEGYLAKASNWSRAMGLHAELQPRLQMALAALEAHRGAADGDIHDFAYKMIQGSQLDWSRASTPRYVTAQGPFGAASPLMDQFMGYRIRLSTMLYREMHDMFGGSAEAGKFLAGHLAATTVLAGALGLPMVAVLASVYDKLADTLTGQKDHDIIASFRGHLADTFGKGAAEAIARGAPRLAGLDFSRLGDQKIAPGSDMVMLLTEKRKFEDAEKDWLKNMAGSSVGMMAKFALGARDISNGDYLRGAIKMAPEAMRGPVEAVQQALYGYRSKTGQKLPITSNAATIALTAMGLDPAGEEEYQEVNATRIGLQTRQAEQTATITQHLAQALSRGDSGDFQKWIGQSNAFMRSHPGVTPPIANLNQYMAEQARNAAMAQAMGTPVGTKMNDLATRGMVTYGNLQRQ